MALWGGRFSSETDREVTEFSESISYDKRLYRWDIVGSKAHSAMLASTGIIPAAAVEKIHQELDVIEKRISEGDFNFTSELEDIHMHIESALIDKLGDEGARVHTARSRNDQVALDIRLYLRDEITVLRSMIKEFQQALVDQADKTAEMLMPGFTHLQHAQVVPCAHHLLAYVEMLDRDSGRLADCRNRLNVLPLGSGALAGTTLPIDRQFVCDKLAFDRITRNSMDAVADRDFAIELVSDLAIFAMHVSRLSEDLILWCSQEFDFVELDDAFCTGSSLMPQKKNPDIAELSRGKTARVYGDLMALLTLCKGLPLTYNRDMQEDKEQIFDALDTVKKILRVFPPMIATMRFKAENMLEAASDPALMATDLAERLVELGMPFRNAHHRVGSLVKWCRENNKKLNEVSLNDMRQTIPEADEQCTQLFTPESSAGKRKVFGSAGFGPVREQVDYWKQQLAGE